MRARRGPWSQVATLGPNSASTVVDGLQRNTLYSMGIPRATQTAATTSLLTLMRPPDCR